MSELVKIYMRKSNDCQTACYATLLGLNYEDVPVFYDDENRLDPNWLDIKDGFLSAHGYQSLRFENATGELMAHLKGFYIAGVPSIGFPEEGHAVICKDGKIWHDPYKNASGEYGPFLDVELLVPLFV